MLNISTTDDIAILTMNDGKVNTIDLDFVNAGLDALSKIETGPSRALILTGEGRCFSAGLNLYKILDSIDYTREFLPKFSEFMIKLFSLKKPVIAAINGHAIAGGCFLAAACDHRVMAEGSGKIGMPELKVGVPFPTFILELARFALPSSALREVILFGHNYEVANARKIGLIDEAVPSDKLMAVSLEKAKELAAVPPRSFEFTKSMLQRPVLESYEKAADWEKEILADWESEEVRTRVRSYIDNATKKG